MGAKHTYIDWVNGVKNCNVCGLNKFLNEFNTDKRRKSGYRAECRKCGSQQSIRARAKRDPEELKMLRSEYMQRLKHEVMDNYGGVCICCKENNKGFLTFDHVNNDGKVHRKELGFSSSYSIALWAKRNNYPSSLQLMCFNCNLGRAINGGVCPHDDTH